MADLAPFPLPFRSLRTIRGEGDKPFIVGAMFTATHSQMAAKLAASCSRFSLPYVLHEVPTVHRSISIHGGTDLSFTKANFIHHLLETHKKPVLYLDSDCEFSSQPQLIADIEQSGRDFAIYNGFADEHSDKFTPIDLKLADLPSSKDRYYRFAGSCDLYSTTQLSCCGAVQFYRNSWAARALLSKWHQAVASFPGCADDHCLDFAYNNLGRRSWLFWLLKSQWLPKPYVRYAYWIYVEPVINHRDFPAPNSHFIPIKDSAGRQRYYRSLMRDGKAAPIFPRDCIIDTQRRLLCKLVAGQLVPVGPVDQPFWLPETALRQ